MKSGIQIVINEDGSSEVNHYGSAQAIIGALRVAETRLIQAQLDTIVRAITKKKERVRAKKKAKL